MATIIPAHALAQAFERGVSIDEIHAILAEGTPISAHSGRSGRVLVLPFNRPWGRRGRVYPQKRVVVCYTDAGDDQVVVTGISQFGRWEA